MGAFEALLELPNVHPQRPGGVPLTVEGMSYGWNDSTRTEAVTAVRLVVASSGKTPCSSRYTQGESKGGLSW